MLRLLIIAHAPLATALKEIAAHIDAEAAANVAACDVRASQSLDDAIAAGGRALEALGAGETLILTDVFGATPCNAACRLGERPRTRVIAGVNVPVLWRALGHLSEPLDVVAELAVSGGQQGLMHVKVTRPQFQTLKPPPNDQAHDHHQQ